MPGRLGVSEIVATPEVFVRARLLRFLPVTMTWTAPTGLPDCRTVTRMTECRPTVKERGVTLSE